MSKKLKYAKLRLTKLVDTGASSLDAANEPMQEPTDLDVGENSSKSCKKSKYFNEDRCSQNTFIEIESEQSTNGNETINENNPRRRAQEGPSLCAAIGLKLPKIRKKASNGNTMVDNFLKNPSSKDVHNGDDVFEETRKTLTSECKQTKVQRAARTTKGPKKPKSQSDIRNLFKKYKNDYDVLHELIKSHSVSEQIDPDHLQMALAMSRSLDDQQNQPSVDSSPNSSGSKSSDERKIVKIRTTLEQFGFKCKNSYTDYDVNLIFGNTYKNVKKIKHNRVTNLQCRTAKELSDFINRQTKKLFSREMFTLSCGSDEIIPSETVKSYISHLFWIAQTEQASLLLANDYYVPELLEANAAPIGCLLKDWNKIPGRETTPEAEDYVSKEHFEIPSSSVAQQPVYGLVLPQCPKKPLALAPLETYEYVQNSAEQRDTVTSPDLFGEFDDLLGDEHRQLMDDKIVQSSLRNIENENAKKRSELLDQNLDFSQNSRKESTVSIEDSRKITVENPSGIAGGSVISLNVINTDLSIKIKPSNQDKMAAHDHSRITAIELTSCKNLSKSNIVAPSLDHSADNIFDMSDKEPIVCFEDYSSEEEKISPEVPRSAASFHQVMKQSDETGMPEKNTETVPYNSEQIQAQSPRSDELKQDATVEAYGGLRTIHTQRDAKDLSFNRIAVKARLSEALANNTFMVETVELADDNESYEENVNGSAASHLNFQNNTSCDGQYISNDEEYISKKNDRIDPVENDLELTIPYYDSESLVKQQLDESNASAGWKEQQCSTENNQSKSNYSEVSANNAERTFAYLESLVNQFNLLPPRMQVGTKDCKISKLSDLVKKAHSSTVSCSESDDQMEHHYQPEPVASIPDVVGPNRDILTGDSSSYAECEYFPDGLTMSEDLKKSVHLNINDTNFHPETSSKGSSPIASGFCPSIKEVKTVKQVQYQCNFQSLKSSVISNGLQDYLISVTNDDCKPPQYEKMSTPEIERELFKCGLKILNRSKAIKVLHHLFRENNPFVEVRDINLSDDNNKKYMNAGGTFLKSKTTKIAARVSPSTRILKEKTLLARICAFKLDPDAEQLFLPSKPPKKFASCAVPLHIAFFNLVSECVTLQRQMLRYDPIDLDDVLSVLKDAGLSYETNDMIAFLDKRCITFRCASGGRSKTKATNLNLKHHINLHII